MYIVCVITNLIYFRSQITCIKKKFNLRVIINVICIVNPKLHVNIFNHLHNY